MKTDQEIFDTVLAHLRKQGEPALDITGACVYRDGNGLSCALGCLIPDSLYTPQIETAAMFHIIDDSPTVESITLGEILGKIGIEPRQYKLLLDLQNAHDKLLQHFKEGWETRMREIADNHKLKWTEKS